MQVEIYVDGRYWTTASWDHDSDTDQHLDVPLWDVPFGTHAVAVRFVNDYWNPGAGEDRNLYLEALKASNIGVVTVLSGGEDWDAWRSTDTYEDGWETRDFDDSRWREAYAPYPNPSRPDEIICGTTARFIWDYPGGGTPSGRNGPVDAWFRKTVYLDQVSEVSRADVILGADDDFDFFVNGKKVFSDWDGTAWSAPFTVDIRPHLVEGDNVLAVHARDSYGIYEWLLFDAVIE